MRPPPLRSVCPTTSAGTKRRAARPKAPEQGSQMFDLTGKTALVTGATGPIGGSIARTLHAQSATVAICGTRREGLDKLCGELGGRVHILPGNLADTAETEALVPRAEELMGQLDVLVANA